MKNITWIIFGFFITSSLYSQIINIPDANFKAKLLQSDNGVGIAYGVGGSFKIDANNNGEIEMSEVLPVLHLKIQGSNISDLTGIEYFINLNELRCEVNSLTELDVTMLPLMRTLGVYNNNLTDLNIVGLSNLESLYASGNSLTSIDLTGLSSLSSFDIYDNEISSIDFSDAPNIHFIRCYNNLLTTLDVSAILELLTMDCSNNQLETLNIKNGFSEFAINFSGNENLQFICADDLQIMSVQDKINEYGYTNCFTNSLCTFVEGEEFYTISGNVSYDEDANGCDSDDVDYPELMFSLSDGTNSGTAFADALGNYTYSLQAGMYTFTPIIENPTYFNISPTSININFPEEANANIRDFCVIANGVYPDLRIVMTGEDSGYDRFASYSIVFTNIGTMTQSGTIGLTFDDNMAVFNSSVPNISSQTGNEISWDFSDLRPFESRKIEFIMDLTLVESNSNGEILVSYLASINSSLTDTTPINNIYQLSQPFFCCLLAVDEFVFSDYFSQYPNPTSDYLNLKLKKHIDVKAIVVYNLLGQEVRRVDIKNEPIKIDVSTLVAGNYFVKIMTPQKVFNTRFIKK